MKRCLPVTVAIAVVGAATTPTYGHWSASRSRSLHTQRYLVCNDKPHQRVACAGPMRARAQLLAAIGGSDSERAHEAAVDAVYFNVREAIPALRNLLATRGDDHERIGLRAEAAYALAHLGDESSAPAILVLVGELERAGYGFLWEDTLAALAVIDAPRAARYANEFLTRAKDFRISMPGGGSKLRALDYVDAGALPVLAAIAAREENGYQHAYCQAMAVRARFDNDVRRATRARFAASYSGSWLAGCANDVLSRWVVSDDDAEFLIRHLGRSDTGTDFGVTMLAYQRLLDLLATSRTAPRDAIRRGLVERSAWSYLRLPHMRALWVAALAGTGDRDGIRQLGELIDDPRDTTGAAWIAALWALRLDIADIRDRVAALMARGVAVGNSERTGIYADVRRHLLDAYADRYPGDGRWAVMLLDGDSGIIDAPSLAAERALYRLSRNPPSDVCDTVAAAAVRARPSAAEHGFLALTVVGDRCRSALARVIESGASPEVRGAALEILGALGAPDLRQWIERATRGGVWKPAIERAKRWPAN